LKTDVINTAPAEASSAQPVAQNPLLQVVLERQPLQRNLPPQVDGLMLGTLCHLDETGLAQVQPDNIQEGPLAAISMIAIKPEDVGTARFVLGFQDGNPRKPIILGRVWTPSVEASVAAEGTPVNADSPVRKKLVVHADEELELRCGQAVILLQADGRIELRGRTITSHADVLYRVRSGIVQMN